MRKALAILNFCIASLYVCGVSAQTYNDLFDEGVYHVPPAIAFGDSAYSTSLSLAVTGIIALLLFAAIVGLAFMVRSDNPPK